MTKLKHKELADFRTNLWVEQRGICPLCNNAIFLNEAVLDHDHKTGHVRAVLHRGCNQAEGRVKTYAGRVTGGDAVQFLQSVLQYWDSDFTENPIHPTHVTDDEKRIKELKKKLKKGSSQAYMARWRAELRRLNATVQ